MINRYVNDSKNNEHSVVSLFAGCGGLDSGFIDAGFNIVWANEYDTDSCKTYSSFFNHTIEPEDIRDVWESAPKADIVIGGPPCQSFSLVGKRLEDDERSQFPMIFHDIVKKTNPKVFVMENVPGLLASKVEDERYPQFLMKLFYECGYSCELIKLVATDFGVPQLRKRVFIIGQKGFMPPSLQIPSGREFVDSFLTSPEQRLPVSSFDALDDLPEPGLSQDDQLRYLKPPASSYAKYMRRNDPEKFTLHYVPTMSARDREFVRHIPPGGNYMDIPDSVSTQRIMNFKRTGGRTTTYGRLHPDKPSYTINTYFNRPNVGSNYHYRDERLITPREALRLQSFPDHFSPHYSSQRSLFRQIGNAVPPLLARAIAEGVKSILK